MFEEQEIVQEQVEQVEQVQPSPEAVAQEKQEANFRAMREKNKQLERERDAALRIIEEEKLRAKYANQPQQAPQHTLDDDDIPDVRYVKNQYAELKRELDEERRKQEDQRKTWEAQNAYARLAAAHPDYQELLSDRNIELLRTLKPELMASIESMPDMYAKGVAAIDAVKAYGVVGHDKYKAEKDAIRAQVAKPKAVNAISASPSNSALNQAHNFSGVMDDTERQRVYLEAVRRSRGQ